jgi:hypothetical protein
LGIAKQMPQVSPEQQGAIAQAKRTPAQIIIDDKIAGIAQVTNDADFAKLPKGARYRGPDGILRSK